MKMHVRLVALTVGALSAATAVGQSYYELIDVGVINNALNSIANDINVHGQVVGDSGGRSYLYHNCKKVDLGNFGRAGTYAQAINDFGAVVGKAPANAQTSSSYLPFIYQNGVMRNLAPGDMKPLSFWYGVEDINNSMTAVGARGGWSGWPSGGVYYSGGFSYLLPPNAFSPTGINDADVIVGYTHTSTGVAGLVGAISGRWINILGLPAHGTNVYPAAINAGGQIVGKAGDQLGSMRAFLVNGDPTQPALDLGTLGGRFSAALDINTAGTVVGTSTDPSDTPSAFVYVNSQMFDLNTRVLNRGSWHLLEAKAINDNGWIAGVGKLNGYHRAFMLRPRPANWVGPPTCGIVSPPTVGR